jgi:hypothetical protein
MAPLTIKFTVGGQEKYQVPILELPGHTQNIQANLQDGDHIFNSADFQLGTLHALGGVPIIGRLSFGYTYDEKKNSITVCGSDFPSADGMKLVTMPEGIDEACIEHAAPCGFAADEGYKNLTWNYQSQLMPGAVAHFKKIVRDANNALVEALRAQPGLTVTTRQLFPELPQDAYHKLCLVLEGDKVLGPCDPKVPLGSEHVVGIVDSTYAGQAIWGGGPFSNVESSKDNPKPNGESSWMEVWGNEWNSPDPEHCSSYQTRPLSLY